MREEKSDGFAGGSSSSWMANCKFVYQEATKKKQQKGIIHTQNWPDQGLCAGVRDFLLLLFASHCSIEMQWSTSSFSVTSLCSSLHTKKRARQKEIVKIYFKVAGPLNACVSEWEKEEMKEINIFRSFTFFFFFLCAYAEWKCPTNAIKINSSNSA